MTVQIQALCLTKFSYHVYLGTEAARGILKWRKHLHSEDVQHQQQDNRDVEVNKEAMEKRKSKSSDVYNLPCGMSFIRRWTLCKFLPFCPTFLVDKLTNNNDEEVELEDGDLDTNKHCGENSV